MSSRLEPFPPPSDAAAAATRRGAPAVPTLVPAARSRRPVVLSLAGTLLFACVLAFPGLGARPLISPAEARYALVAREMLETGDWITPRFNHARFYEKPPLTYWSVAAAYRLFGYTEFASRLPSALAYVGTVGVTFLLALELVGSAAAPMAALVFATSLGPFLFGRFLFTDTLLVFWLSVSLLGLTKIVRGRSPLAGPLLFYAGASLAVLTKGLIGLVFPLGAAAVYGVFSGGREFARRLRPGAGTALLAILVLPWHVLLARRDPEFLSFYFVHEQLDRFLGQRTPVNYTPLSAPAFWISTLLWFFPWLLFLPAALSRRRERWQRLAPAGIWCLLVVGFFSMTGARLEYYALPAFPALAVIVASGWTRFEATGRRSAAMAAPSYVAAALGLVALPVVFLTTRSGSALLTNLVASLDGYYREYFTTHPGASMIFGNELLRRARPFPIVLLLLAGATLAAMRVEKRRGAFALWVLGAVPILGLADSGMRLVAVDRSQRAAAAIVARQWAPGAKLVVAGDYEEGCGITFYTGRETQVLGGPGAELLFGFRRGDAPEVFLTPEAFLESWRSSAPVFVLGNRDLTLPGAAVLMEGPRSRLLLQADCAAVDDSRAPSVAELGPPSAGRSPPGIASP